MTPGKGISFMLKTMPAAAIIHAGGPDFLWNRNDNGSPPKHFACGWGMTKVFFHVQAVKSQHCALQG